MEIYKSSLYPAFAEKELGGSVPPEMKAEWEPLR